MHPKFDPDNVDLAMDPEYLARVAARGARPLSLPSDSISRAKRLNMYLVDIEMNAQWLTAMSNLLELDLDDTAFTAHRMLLLERWIRARKLAQHNLSYKYDRGRRRAGLVDHDEKQTLAKYEKLRAQLEDGIARMVARHPAPNESDIDDESIAIGRGTRARPARLGNTTRGQRPEHLDESVFEMIVADTGVLDPVNATDETILEAYEVRGQGGYPAEYFLALLRRRALPERPEELG